MLLSSIRVASMRARFHGPLLGCLLALAFATTAFAQNATVTLLHINDVYEIAPVKGQGGLAELMTLLRQERPQHPNPTPPAGGASPPPSILWASRRARRWSSCSAR